MDSAWSSADANICVIGAGIAGLVLAYQLSRGGSQVLLLESGDSQSDVEAESLNEIDNVNGRWTGALRSRCRGIGGTSQLWGGRTIPIAVDEGKPWPNTDLSGWPFPLTDIERYNKDVEAILRIDDSSYEAELYPEHDSGDADFRLRWAKWPRFANCNLGRRLRQSVIEHPGVTIWKNATVTGFTSDENGRITSVTAEHQSGRQLEVSARQFVLAAGAIESTRLLLFLERQRGAADPESVLGHHFQDHINLKAATLVRHDARAANTVFGYRFLHSIRRSMHLELTSQAQAECGVGSAFAYVSMDLEGSALRTFKSIGRNLQKGKIELGQLAGLSRHAGLVGQSLAWRYGRHRLYVPETVPFNVEICVEQAPHWDNRITLSERRDRFGVPLARVDWAPRPGDEVTLRTAVEKLGKSWVQRGWDNIASLGWIDAVADRQSSLTDYSTDYHHPSGTTPMGTNRKTSVTDANLTCHGVPNLNVLSASVFPRAGSANPTFTLMRMALRLGDHLMAHRA